MRMQFSKLIYKMNENKNYISFLKMNCVLNLQSKSLDDSQLRTSDSISAVRAQERKPKSLIYCLWQLERFENDCVKL